MQVSKRGVRHRQPPEIFTTSYRELRSFGIWGRLPRIRQQSQQSQRPPCDYVGITPAYSTTKNFPGSPSGHRGTLPWIGQATAGDTGSGPDNAYSQSLQHAEIKRQIITTPFRGDEGLPRPRNYPFIQRRRSSTTDRIGQPEWNEQKQKRA